MRNKSEAEVESAQSWPKEICDYNYCDSFHCGVCCKIMDLFEHGAGLCHKREAKKIQTMIEHHNIDAMKTAYKRLDANGHLGAVEDELRVIFPTWDKG